MIFALYLVACINDTNCYAEKIDHGLTYEDCQAAMHDDPSLRSKLDLTKYEVAWVECEPE